MQLKISGKIPIIVHPIFWVLAVGIGVLNSQSILGIFLWAFVVFISVLVHEMGHALTALFFKLHPRIELTFSGGMTFYENTDIKRWQSFLIVFNGPLFGLGLFFCSFLLLKGHIFSSYKVNECLFFFQQANLFWSVLNLFPVIPLDGGYLLKIVLEGFFGLRGWKISVMIGMIFSLVVGIVLFLMQGFFLGALFFLFAYQSFEMWKQGKFLSFPDRKKENAEDLRYAEEIFQAGKKEEAKTLFLKIREKTKKGVFFSRASYYLALLEHEEGQTQKAYQYLVEIENQLPIEAFLLLQKVAFDQKDYEKVAKISSECYQAFPIPDVALRNAKAFAFLKKGKLSGGWLKAFLEKSKIDLAKILEDSIFEEVRNDPEFKKFFS